MEKLKKSAGGEWTTRVYLGRDARGKKIVRRVSGPDRASVQMEAARLEADAKNARSGQCTWGQAYKMMMQERAAVLSPSTVHGYDACARVLRDNYAPIYNKSVYKIKRPDVQEVINDLASAGRSPKTVHNYYLLINAVLKYKGGAVDGVVLPGKDKPTLNIPDVATVRQTIEAARDTDLYVPILLGALGPLRRGEVCGLMTGDISGDVIHVQRSMVQSDDEGWIIKPPKTYASDRYLTMPRGVIDALGELKAGDDGRLFQINPQQLTDSFRRLLRRNNIPHYRFHDLRHFCASYLHARGVPDVYIQQRTGHASPQVLRQVYTHTMTDQSESETARMMQWFDDMMS